MGAESGLNLVEYTCAVQTEYGTLMVEVMAEPDSDHNAIFFLACEKAEDAVSSAKNGGVWK